MANTQQILGKRRRTFFSKAVSAVTTPARILLAFTRSKGRSQKPVWPKKS